MKHKPADTECTSSAQRFKDGVRQVSSSRKSGYRSNKEALLYLSKHADPQKQKQALATLVAEEPQCLMEITDRYITERGERSALLGFVITDNIPTTFVYQALPSVAAMTKKTREKYNAALRSRTAAGAATILDCMGTIPEMDDPFFLPKESIFLGNDRKVEEKILLEMIARADKAVSECIRAIKKKMIPFQKYLHPPKYHAHRNAIDEAERVFRIFHDIACQLESALYCESLGNPFEHWRLDELESRYFESLNMISLVRKENI